MDEDTNPAAMGQLALELGAALNALLDSGFVLPLHVAIVGVRGSAFIFRYTQGAIGLDAIELAKHSQGDVALPVNIMICDSTGDAARVVIRHDGPPQLTVLQ